MHGLSRFAAPVVALGCGVLAACGSSAAPTPTPRVLTVDQVRTLYVTAANAYNQQERTIALSENTYCDPSSATADLTTCQRTLSQDRQTTLAYDTGLRAIAFAGASKADSIRLLADDAAIESLLQQASAAPTLTTISTLAQEQIFPLLSTAAKDAGKLRADIGLPAPT